MDAYIVNILQQALTDDVIVTEAKKNGGAWCIEKCLEVLRLLTTSSSKHNDQIEHLCDALLRFSWEKLHCGYWKDVSICWRYIYSISSILFAHCTDDLHEKIRQLDMALMMGAPDFQPHIHPLVEKFHDQLSASQNWSSPLNDQTSQQPVQIVREIDPNHAVPRIESPSLVTFLRDYMLKDQPVIITNVVSTWPALSDSERNWKNLDYLKKVAGFRTVPIEIGGIYTDTNWGQALMTLADFIDIFILHKKPPPRDEWKGQTGYLAQTQLFDQIRLLKADIVQPDYCSVLPPSCDGDDKGESKVLINAWFGPANTISPCHQDPYHNLLCQVVGSKYLRLFAPHLSERLYPHEERMLFNTSRVDVMNPDLTQFPLMKDIPYLECVLNEGDMLYLPPQWWHYVQSLTTSFSVSWWWS